MTQNRLWFRRTCAAAQSLSAAALLASAAPALAYTVVGDGIPRALTTTPGDAQRGQALVANRQTSLCLLCHSAPFGQASGQGTVASNLSGSGSRWTTAQLRLRVANARHLAPHSPMPIFHPAQGPDPATQPQATASPNAARVAAAWAGKPILTAQQLEDVVAYLSSLP